MHLAALFMRLIGGAIMPSKDYNKKQWNKKVKRINKATADGKCWWLHQMLMAYLQERPNGRL